MKKIIVGCLIAIGLVTSANAMSEKDREYLNLRAIQGQMKSVRKNCNVVDISYDVGSDKVTLNFERLALNFPKFYKQIRLNYKHKKAVEIFFSRPSASDLSGLRNILSDRMFKEEPASLVGFSYYATQKYKKKSMFGSNSFRLIQDLTCYNNFSDNKYYGHNGREYISVLVAISLGQFSKAENIIVNSIVIEKTIKLLPWVNKVAPKYY